MFLDDLNSFNVILGSKSPRRSEILQKAGVRFKVNVFSEINETFPSSIPANEVAAWLSEKKANINMKYIGENDILITADTVVVHDNMVLNKPFNKDEANAMLKILSNNTHQVYTGVALTHNHRIHTFQEKTIVTFSELQPDEINYYIEQYKPFDKAGAYGIQEWIGLIGIQKIEGCYYNVMGLPINRLISELKTILKCIR